MKGGINKACAACKYQRRRCAKDCALSPYFPADKPKMFSNAHRLFGVSNIIRILKQVEPDERDEAMKSIIYESDIRAKYPQQGCYGVILQYQALIYKAMEELRYVQMLLAFIKQAHHHPRQNQNLVLMDNSGGDIDAKPNLTPIQDVPRAISTNYFNIIGSTSSEITNAGSDIEAKSALNTYAVENYDIVAKCEKLNLMEVEGPSNCNEFDISQYMSFNVFENTGKSSEEPTSTEDSSWENI
ncbi:LOB domain-containing protein 27-like [Lotus japonicus]|uniref:LOB domain-containing protein 27-like n=1 Tax=Lotus japonicus TaxID=34305 RepID=UPI002588032D|nr:LOB domain-containing protein 27-like [Lotus japonicus]